MKREADRLIAELIGTTLRARGFTGTRPLWRRDLADGEVWLVSTEHDKHGGGFRAELGWMPPRGLFPRIKRPRRLAVRALWFDFRASLPSGKFVRYEGDVRRAAGRVASAVEKNVPVWFLRNQAVAKRLGPSVTSSTLRALLRERLWVRQWMNDNEALAGCLAWSRAALAKSKDAAERALLAWPLAKHGDRKAHALLVSLLDHPPEKDPVVPIRAAQALADIHGWRFRWDLSSVAGVKKKVLATGPGSR